MTDAAVPTRRVDRAPVSTDIPPSSQAVAPAGGTQSAAQRGTSRSTERAITDSGPIAQPDRADVPTAPAVAVAAARPRRRARAHRRSRAAPVLRGAGARRHRVARPRTRRRDPAPLRPEQAARRTRTAPRHRPTGTAPTPAGGTAPLATEPAVEAAATAPTTFAAAVSSGAFAAAAAGGSSSAAAIAVVRRRRLRDLPDRLAPPHAAPAADPLHLAERAPRLRTSSPQPRKRSIFRR